MIDGQAFEKLRCHILMEHDELRAAIAKVISAADPARLAVATNALLDRLTEHLAYEERALEPVLRAIDAWGPERARRMREDHRAQRVEIAKLREELATAPTGGLGRPVRPFVDELLADMAVEERDVLSLLRDDAVTVELGG